VPATGDACRRADPDGWTDCSRYGSGVRQGEIRDRVAAIPAQQRVPLTIRPITRHSLELCLDIPVSLGTPVHPVVKIFLTWQSADLYMQSIAPLKKWLDEQNIKVRRLAGNLAKNINERSFRTDRNGVFSFV
jgi:hypothetical protein